jgi:hypothetical protein
VPVYVWIGGEYEGVQDPDDEEVCFCYISLSLSRARALSFCLSLSMMTKTSVLLLCVCVCVCVLYDAEEVCAFVAFAVRMPRLCCMCEYANIMRNYL